MPFPNQPLFDNTCFCPKCHREFSGVFPTICPYCGLSTEVLANMGTTDFQQKKLREHSSLITGSNIPFYGKEYNASFTIQGFANLQSLVRFTLSYGTALPMESRGSTGTRYVSYLPEEIGVGTSLYRVGEVPCRGLCIVSPQSMEWGHSHPFMNDWLKTLYGDLHSFCRICRKTIEFGGTLCKKCYDDKTSGWESLLV